MMFILCLLVAVLAGTSPLPACADETGGVALVCADADGRALAGEVFELHRVADYAPDADGSFAYATCEAFSELGDDWVGLTTEQRRAKAVAAERIAEGVRADARLACDERGRARVDGLDLGVYLLRRTVAGRPGTVVEPVLVSVPALVDGSISMCVEVHPKFGVKPIAPPSRPGTDIPTTGDVVMAAGICMLIAGSVMFVAGHLLASRRADA